MYAKNVDAKCLIDRQDNMAVAQIVGINYILTATPKKPCRMAILMVLEARFIQPRRGRKICYNRHF